MSLMGENYKSAGLYLAVFMNAFVDLGHKIIIQNTIFKLYDGSLQIFLTAIVNALILLPFILLLTPAGYLSDRFRKSHVMRYSGWCVIAGVCVITICYYNGWFVAAFVMTFMLAAQSAIFGPAKYGFVKEYYGKRRLGEINGALASLSIVAILLGTFAFSIGFEVWYQQSFPVGASNPSEILRAIAPLGWLLLISSIVELWAIYRIPVSLKPGMHEPFRWQSFLAGQEMKGNLGLITTSRPIRQSVFGLAVFWSSGQVMLAAFPAFLKEVTGEDNVIIIQGILACAGIGIAAGAVFAGRFSRDYIETGLLPIAALGIALGLLTLPHTDSHAVAAFLFLFIGFMGGMFIVPLNALIQFFAREKSLGRTLAASNWAQNMSMLFFLGVTAVFSYQGWTSKTLLQLIAVVALAGSFYTVYQLPQSLTRFMLSVILSRVFRLKITGMKNIPAHGGVLLLGNHISWIDWALVQIACPRIIRFVMTDNIYRLWYLRWFFDLFETIPIRSNASSRDSIGKIARALDDGDVVCLFPEGMISGNGQLSEFRKGYALACARTTNSTIIIPFYLRGLWGSKFSRSDVHLRKSDSGLKAREIIVAFGKKLPKDTSTTKLKQVVTELSISTWNEYVETLPTLGQRWIDICCRYRNRLALINNSGEKLLARKALGTSISISRRMQEHGSERHIGIILPNDADCMLANMAAFLAGKVVVNLNSNLTEAELDSAIRQAGIRTVYSSRIFLDELARKGVNLEFLQGYVDMIFLEQIFMGRTILEKFLVMAGVTVMPSFFIKKFCCSDTCNSDTAVILFTPGTDGLLRGIMLSHKNIMANIKQITEMLNLGEADSMLSNLPPYNAFGATVTMFLPLLEGIPVVCNPDPLDAQKSAKLILDHQITLLMGTPQIFESLIVNDKVHPLMLKSLRLIGSGEGQLKADIHKNFKLKFNKDIFEGYGATETSPVSSVNLPDILNAGNLKIQRGNKFGSMGMPVPGTGLRIVDPETFESLPAGEAGLLLISGPQLMQGYLNGDRERDVFRCQDGLRWFVSGDMGYLDEDGFLFILRQYTHGKLHEA